MQQIFKCTGKLSSVFLLVGSLSLSPFLSCPWELPGNDRKGEMSVNSATNKNLKVSLRAQWRLTTDWLFIEYQLDNQEEVAIVAFDGAKGDANEEWPDLSSQLYVSFEHPNTVHIKRIMAPPPKKFDITVLRVPSVSRTPPSSVRTVRLRLPIPLQERSEYFPHFDEAPYKNETARHVILWIGYVPEVDGMKLIPCAPGADVYRLQGNRPRQQFVNTRAELTIPVRVRQDDDIFERL